MGSLYDALEAKYKQNSKDSINEEYRKQWHHTVVDAAEAADNHKQNKRVVEGLLSRTTSEDVREKLKLEISRFESVIKALDALVSDGPQIQRGQ